MVIVHCCIILHQVNTLSSRLNMDYSCTSKYFLTNDIEKTRNVSMGHGCPRYCQIRINRALSLTKGHNSDNNWWILSIIELDLYFMIIYLCMKYKSNIPMLSKDIARKPFSYVRDRTYGTYVRTDKGDAICPPPHYKWRGHNNNKNNH